MKLDPDCIRNILFAVEENTGFSSLMGVDESNFNRYEQLKNYEFEKVAYHIMQCGHCGYFTDMKQTLDGSFMIVDLSPKGHEFLANIRNDNNWKKIKDTAQKIGSFSLGILADIAKDYISSKLR